MSITGNQERDNLLRAATDKVIGLGKTPSLKLVARQLPEDFDLLDTELSAMLLTLRMDGEAAGPETQENFGALGEAEADTADIPPAVDAPGAKITHDQARAAVEAAHKRLAMARVAVITARQRLDDTKVKLSRCITAWQSSSDEGTAEQRQQREIRNHLAAEAARKQALKDAGVQPNRMRTDKFPASTVIDGKMVTGTKGNHHGAFPSSYQHRNINTPGTFRK